MCWPPPEVLISTAHIGRSIPGSAGVHVGVVRVPVDLKCPVAVARPFWPHQGLGIKNNDAGEGIRCASLLEMGVACAGRGRSVGVDVDPNVQFFSNFSFLIGGLGYPGFSQPAKTAYIRVRSLYQTRTR